MSTATGTSPPDTAPSGVREVLTSVAPVCLGMVPLGLAFGLLVIDAALAWWWAPVFTGLVYAGSLEFLLIGMAVAAAPLSAVALTAAVVNSRHVFYALSFPLHRVRGPLARAYSAFALTDEAYALTAGPRTTAWRTRQILTMQVLLHASWVLPATAGALLGASLPLERLRGLGFALTALFLVLAVDAYRSRPDRAVAAAAAVCVALAWLVVPGQLLPAAFAAFTALLVLRQRRSRAHPASESARAERGGRPCLSTPPWRRSSCSAPRSPAHCGLFPSPPSPRCAAARPSATSACTCRSGSW